MNDEQILYEVANGDHRAFEELYNRFSEKVYNTSLSYVKNKEDAEEITQKVFLKIFKHAYSFKNKSSVNTWIYRIVVNTSLNHIKSKNRHAFFSSTLEKHEPLDFNHPGVLLEQKENANLLFKVIDSLSDRQRTALILSYIECLPRQEVADIMEVSLKSIESLLHRAKQNLRIKLEITNLNRRK